MRFFEILFEDIWSDIATNWSDKENIPLDQVESYINKYKQLKQKNMFDNPEHKDIQHIYKNMDFLEFKQLIDQAEIKANQTKGAIRSKIKNSKDAIVYRDDSDWLIVVPKNKETSQNIGTETKWCTSTRESGNLFNPYTLAEHGTMVYLINKQQEQKLTNNKSKYAIRFNDETGSILEIENPQQKPHNLPKKRFTNETGFNPHEIVALIRNSSEWKEYEESKYENLSLFDLIKNGKIDLVKKKIESGADVNIKDNDGNSPLILASSEGCIEIVKLLIDHGVGVDVKNNNGDTSLYWAAEKGHSEIVKLLLEHGADVNAKNKDRSTPLHWASCNWRRAEIVKLLIDRGADVNAKDNNGSTPLFYGSSEIIELLLEHGADVNAKNNYGTSTLYYASKEGHSEIVKLLLEHGADVEVKDVNGRNSLFWASRLGYAETVKLLLEHGADVNIKDKYGETPLILAYRDENTKIVNLLKAHGATE